MCLWLLAEGVDTSVLVRFTGHVDATISRWLTRAGRHSTGLHHTLFVNLELEYLQVDELKAPIVGDRENWLWAAIEPVSKIVPAIHIGKRSNDDAMIFIHYWCYTWPPAVRLPLQATDFGNISTRSPLILAIGSILTSNGSGR
jgi:hypothetical protein